MRHNNKFGLVTGAAGFLGIVHCESILEKYDGLIMVDINKNKMLKNYQYLKKKFNTKKIYLLSIDLNKDQKFLKITKLIKKNGIFIRVLINNACIDPKPNKNSPSLNIKSWDSEFNVGLKAATILIDLLSKYMIKKKDGCIINIASDLSVIAPNQKIYKNIYKNFKKPVTYSLIKHAIVGLTKYYAADLAKFGITCNAISPSGVFNKQNKKFITNLVSLIPMKRMAKKSDINNLVDFLINDEQKYMTGQNLLIDGGRTII